MADMTTEEALETVREALTFRSSDPDDTHDALAALNTLRAQLERQEAALRVTQENIDIVKDWTMDRFGQTLRAANFIEEGLRDALSTPPNQGETTTPMDAIGWLGSSGSEVIDMRSTPPNQEEQE